MRLYLGIRVVTPFRGMLKVRDELLREVHAWIEQSDTDPIEHGFLRLHVIDMNGPMDIEVGYFTRIPGEGGGRIKPGSMPAGRYATLTYQVERVSRTGGCRFKCVAPVSVRSGRVSASVAKLWIGATA